MTLRRHRSQAVSALACGLPLAAFVLETPTIGGTLVAFVSFGAAVFALPYVARLMTQLEDAVGLHTAMVSTTHVIRVCIPGVLILAEITALRRENIDAALAIGLILAAAEVQAVALVLAYRGKGDRRGNALVGFLVAAFVTALACRYRGPATQVIVLAMAALYVVHLLVACLSDLRARIYPRRGIGVFFGTFNPVHRTHIAIMSDALRARRLRKIFVHPTTVPKLHRQALENGEIRFAIRDGMRVYETTARADPAKDYFPTGRRFFDYEVRNALLKLAIRDAGLDGRVEVLELPAIYAAEGFAGVLRHIKQSHGGPIHGLHGSDPGGMWVRSLFDLEGWIYPFPVRRRDAVSATAVRSGEKGLTTPTVELFLDAQRKGQSFTFPDGLTIPKGSSSTG